jgi:hypothetical protein
MEIGFFITEIYVERIKGCCFRPTTKHKFGEGIDPPGEKLKLMAKNILLLG